MDGLILVRKPVSWTSHDVVRELRRILSMKRIGHFGTLDPLASGLLLAAVGRATRLFSYFGAYDKSYAARIRLGFATDTYDAAGSPASAERTDLPSAEAVTAVLSRFVGEIDQLPPPYSARKHLGKPLYSYARKNQEVERKPSRVRVTAFTLLSYVPPLVEAEVRCSSGTYVRSLAHDLGLVLGCGAHLDGLVRTEIGPYRLEEARDPDEIRELQSGGWTERFLIPLERLLTDRPALTLSEREAEYVRRGRTVRPSGPRIGPGGLEPAPEREVVRLLGPDGSLVALARSGPEPGSWAPAVVFL
jgi:tRNA pseudouridine55 synthase